MRLDKFLTNMQIGSRSQVKDYIRHGKVSVNQTIVKKPEFQIKEETDNIFFEGKLLNYQRFYYYMLHKPAGIVTATRDSHDKTVMDLLPADAGKNLFPVGRLDKDTEGLLLITNDGELSHRLLSPKRHVDKTYYVECTGYIDDEKLDYLRQGVDIGDDKFTLPAKVSLIQQNEGFYSLCITITEGRFHQVKRMIASISGEVTYLKRISMGSLKLDDGLPAGAYRPLTQEEVAQLYYERGSN